MKFFRTAILIPALVATVPAFAADDDAFGHALTLVQMFVRAAAAQSSDPKAGMNAIDDVLAGRNTEANRAFAGLFEEATAGMPAEHKDKVTAISRDLAALARKEVARGPAPDPVSTDRALQARKDLTAMGLRYYDVGQFLDAVKRDDALAVELYLAGKGVNPTAKGKDGRTALEIARANGNEPLASLISRSLPATR